MQENYLPSVLKGWSVLLCTRFWDIDIKHVNKLYCNTSQNGRIIMVQYSCLAVFSDAHLLDYNLKNIDLTH